MTLKDFNQNLFFNNHLLNPYALPGSVKDTKEMDRLSQENRFYCLHR